MASAPGPETTSIIVATDHAALFCSCFGSRNKVGASVVVFWLPSHGVLPSATAMSGTGWSVSRVKVATLPRYKGCRRFFRLWFTATSPPTTISRPLISVGSSVIHYFSTSVTSIPNHFCNTATLSSFVFNCFNTYEFSLTFLVTLSMCSSRCGCG